MKTAKEDLLGIIICLRKHVFISVIEYIKASRALEL